MRKYILEENCILNQRYRVFRSIGQGGFGITYVAEDENLKQKVVIKEYFPVMLVSRNESNEIVLPEQLEDKKRYEEGMRRFLDEAKILASLFDIPGVVKVLDYFQENKTAYIVMEYVDGISLRDYLERMPEELSFERACEMLKPVMTALEKIHEKGLLHRDINPDNLMLDADGKIKMLDFGSAREYFLEQDREKTLTILVKNGYAPPEQYESKGGQGPWTDIYAICATIYEMMTGCMPPNAKEREVSDELYAPSTYDVAITPEQEERFLKKGLALRSKERYQSVREMMEDFFPEEKEKKIRKTHRKLGVLVAVLVPIVLIIIALSFYSFRQPEEPEVSYAGSFERGSEAYDEFMNFVKEHAVETTESQTNEGYDSTIYTLDEEAVNEINMPSNVNTFALTVDEFLAGMEAAGNTLEEVGTANLFEVEEGAYGVIKTSFLTQNVYETPEGLKMQVRFEYFSKEISYIAIAKPEVAMEGVEYNQFLIDGIETLVPSLEGEISVEEIEKAKTDFEENSMGDNTYLRGFETREICVRFLWGKAKTNEAMAAIYPYGISYSEPGYRW